MTDPAAGPWRKILLSLGTAGLVVAAMLKFIPAAGPAVIPLEAGSRLALEAAAQMPEDCTPTICGCDRKGECGVHGLIGFLDGGRACRCP